MTEPLHGRTHDPDGETIARSLLAVPYGERVLALEDDVRDVFAVSEWATPGHGGQVVFTGQFLRSPQLVFEHVAPRFRERGYLPLLRRARGRDVIVAAPTPQTRPRPRAWINAALFVATVASTILAGAFQEVATEIAPATESNAALAGLHVLREVANQWQRGIPFAVALLGILGVHEFGHYFVARRHGLDSSLPYFVPFPLNPLTGTLGAVIRIQSPFGSRKALFDVGIAGPLAGLAVAIPVTIVGLQDAVVVQGTAQGALGEPLLFQWLARLVIGPRQPGDDLLASPLLMAGWWGMFVTALNLAPLSQLDGGHIAYALFGRWHRYAAWALFAAAAAVTFTVTPGYLLMLALVFAIGIEHPPALDDLTPVGAGRKALGLLALVLFVVLFTIQPFQ